MDAIKIDFRYFIAEMTKREKIKLYHTVLFVIYPINQGRSLGSHIVSYLASRFEFHSTIIFSGFWSVAKIVENKTMAFLGSLIKQKCDNAEYLSQTQCPVLIIHGMKVNEGMIQDELINYKDIVDMYNQLQNKRISLVVTEDMEHNCYSEYTDLYRPIQEFYDHVFPIDKVIDQHALKRPNSINFSRVSTLEI